METDAAIDRYNIGIAREGYGYLAVERKADGAFLGGVGMVPVGLKLRGDPKVEVGWLIGRDYWGQGYAPEAASALLDVAFDTLALPEIVAFTAVVNVPSQRVMQKIGMVRDPLGDFEHPRIPPEHPVRPHVLYRIANPRRAP
jgi:RimJ/RimL family protein N-acetyltransferase